MDDDFIIYDTVTADQDLSAGDQIAFMPIGSEVQEVMVLTRVVDSGDSILVTGDSEQSGDRVTYILAADHVVHLWSI